jgi:hypothetical protein
MSTPDAILANAAHTAFCEFIKALRLDLLGGPESQEVTPSIRERNEEDYELRNAAWSFIQELTHPTTNSEPYEFLRVVYYRGEFVAMQRWQGVKPMSPEPSQKRSLTTFALGTSYRVTAESPCIAHLKRLYELLNQAETAVQNWTDWLMNLFLGYVNNPDCVWQLSFYNVPKEGTWADHPKIMISNVHLDLLVPSDQL